jgi:hypothetical protein
MSLSATVSTMEPATFRVPFSETVDRGSRSSPAQGSNRSGLAPGYPKRAAYSATDVSVGCSASLGS